MNESMGSVDEIYPDACDQAVVRLAAAVLEQAVKDLLSDHESHQRSHDAYDFLVYRFWDPECLWYEVLGQYLSRPSVIQRVHAILRNQKRFSRRVR